MTKFEQLLLLLAQLFTVYAESGLSHPGMLGDHPTPDAKAAVLAQAIVDGVAEKLGVPSVDTGATFAPIATSAPNSGAGAKGKKAKPAPPEGDPNGE